MQNHLHNRIEGLDVLRGIFAFSIMFYHYFTWTHLPLYPFFYQYLHKIASLGVEGFFVLSGFVLFVTYKNVNFRSSKNILKFYAKRWLRIAPLFYLVFLLTYFSAGEPSQALLGQQLASAIIIFIIIIFISPYLLAHYVTGFKKFQNYSAYILLLALFAFITIGFFHSGNKLGFFTIITFTFGFINPASGGIGGSWSIGNEFVFYYFFPLMAIIARNFLGSFLLFLIASILAIIYGIYCHPDTWNFPSQWAVYTKFYYHLVCFCMGLLLSRWLAWKEKIPRKYVLFSICICILLWFWLQSFANPTYSFGRVLFLADLAIIVFLMSIFKINTAWLNRILLFMGDISYTVFLLAFPLKDIFGLFEFGITGILANIATVIILSTLVYYGFERILIEFGRTKVFKLSNQKILSLTK